MEIVFHSHANKTRFHKKGCAPSLILKVRGFGTRKWPINFPLLIPYFCFSLLLLLLFSLCFFFFWEKNVLLLITNLVRLVLRTSVWTTFILDSLFMPGSIWPVTMLPPRPYPPGEFAIFFLSQWSILHHRAPWSTSYTFFCANLF